MDEKSKKQLLDFLGRYLILILIALPNLYLFYLIFTPLTLYPVYFILNSFLDCSLADNVIIVSGCFPIEIINACVAGAAYYLLLALNLATPKIKLRKRINLIIFSFTSFLVLNIIRILLLSLLFVSESLWFDFLHKSLWYLLSILFVAGIWFAGVKIFKIKEIPFYSDFLSLYKKSHLKKVNNSQSP
ncbi:pacearchaeosortase [Candidatus Pacearchaeota archaeon]|nr:pacearchaeosortase [Candidatus Pacearchaeota archaeon]